jgi:hypothetical protein
VRCANIRIHAEIPIPVDTNDAASATGTTFCDGNGVVYSVEAIRQSCENIEDLPIIQRDEHGVEKVVGFTQSIRWNPHGFIEVDGLLLFGGTNETVEFGKDNCIVSMELRAEGEFAT